MQKNGFKSVFVKFSDTYSVPHQLFFKQHKVRDEADDRPSDLTLFICNVPPYYNEDSLKNLFKVCGSVKSVFFADVDSPAEIVQRSDKRSVFNNIEEIKGYKVAYVVFHSAKDLQKAVAWQPSDTVAISNDEFSLITGLKKWCQQYNDNFPDPVEIQKEIDEFMSKYDQDVVEMEKSLKEEGEPDDEGWVTVTKKGRNPGFARKQSVKDNIMKTVRKKKQRKEMKNFYTFQIRESKMNHLCKLREKFEGDKKKIERLRSTRKFKPF